MATRGGAGRASKSNFNPCTKKMAVNDTAKNETSWLNQIGDDY